jgi:hypothetical protein
MVPDISQNQYRYRENEFGGTDDYLTKWKAAEDQFSQDRRSRSLLDTELQNTKLVMNTLAAKFELLQEQSRNESSMLKDMSRMFAQKERESRDAIDLLNKRLEQESRRVHQLVEELSKSRQSEISLNQHHQDQLKHLTEKIESLNGRLEGYVEKSNEFGFNLSSTSNQLVLESRRNEDNLRTIKMHDFSFDQFVIQSGQQLGIIHKENSNGRSRSFPKN